jgi:enoyl-CoA hydratase/carnithine racemase
MSDEVLYDVDGHVATLTLNRPAQRNAVSPELTVAMDAALRRFEEDPQVWVGLLTGAGPNFCAGADLKAIAAGRGRELSTEAGGFAGFVRYPRTKPIIAAVTGFALAGGTELVLTCDMVVAAEDAVFGLPEVTRGIVAAGGGMFRLPRALPPAIARELLLTGGRLPAADAHRLGMANRLVAAEQVVSTARELADTICANAPVAVRETLALARAALEVDEQEAWRRSDEARARVAQSEDAKEGPRAFAEKRAPVWTGR